MSSVFTCATISKNVTKKFKVYSCTHWSEPPLLCLRTCMDDPIQDWPKWLHLTVTTYGFYGHHRSTLKTIFSNVQRKKSVNWRIGHMCHRLLLLSVTLNIMAKDRVWQSPLHLTDFLVWKKKVKNHIDVPLLYERSTLRNCGQGTLQIRLARVCKSSSIHCNLFPNDWLTLEILR